MTPEQYFWFVRRPQILKAQAYAAGGGKSAADKAYDEFMKSFSTVRSYFHTGTVSGYDYEKASGRFPVPKAACSAVRSGRFVGRNLDYYFDELPEFLLKTPAKDGRYATMAVVQYPGIKESDVSGRTSAFRDSVLKLPFPTMDGMNEYGVVTEQNMLPVGDNPDWPSELNSFSGGSKELHAHWNRTFHTRPGKTRRTASMLQRMVLDCCRSVDEAVDLIVNGYDWFSYFGVAPSDFVASGLEIHWMISDPTKTVVVEFVNREYDSLKTESVSDVVVHWYSEDAYGNFSKSKVTRYRNGTEVPAAQTAIGSLAILTNFYLTGWDGDAEGFGKVPHSNSSLTRYAMGLERYKVLDSAYPTFPSEAGQLLDCMKKVEYASQAYAIGGDNHSGDFDKIWYSEFNDPLEGSFANGVHIGLPESSVEARASRTCADCSAQVAAGIRGNASDPDCPWITVNRSVYDMENGKLSIVVQEDGSVREFRF